MEDPNNETVVEETPTDGTAGEVAPEATDETPTETTEEVPNESSDTTEEVADDDSDEKKNEESASGGTPCSNCNATGLVANQRCEVCGGRSYITEE